MKNFDLMKNWNPLAGSFKLKPPKKKGKKKEKNKLSQRSIFTRSERSRFMKAVINWEELIFIRLGFYGGLRISEVASLKVKDVLVEEEVLHVRKSKRNKSRYVNIDIGTILILKTYAHEQGLKDDDYFYPGHLDPTVPKTTKTLSRWFKDILKRSGITRIQPTSHTMRHTNITMLLEKGMPVEQVMEHAGHSDIKYTMIYTHLTYQTRAKMYRDIMGE